MPSNVTRRPDDDVRRESRAWQAFDLAITPIVMRESAQAVRWRIARQNSVHQDIRPSGRLWAPSEDLYTAVGTGRCQIELSHDRGTLLGTQPPRRAEPGGENNWHVLPPELKDHICGYLSPRQLAIAGAVSTEMNALSQGHGTWTTLLGLQTGVSDGRSRCRALLNELSGSSAHAAGSLWRLSFLQPEVHALLIASRPSCSIREALERRENMTPEDPRAEPPDWIRQAVTAFFRED